MSYIFSEDDFNTNGHFIDNGGPEYLAGLLNENEGAVLFMYISNSSY
jgi:hypothetical protein